jgi:hypothetical protein
MTDDEFRAFKRGALVGKLYAEQNLAADRLAYSLNINQMVEHYNEHPCTAGHPTTPEQLFPLLIALRKDGCLVSKGRASANGC